MADKSRKYYFGASVVLALVGGLIMPSGASLRVVLSAAALYLAGVCVGHIIAKS
jgi:hypothetical protein